MGELSIYPSFPVLSYIDLKKAFRSFSDIPWNQQANILLIFLFCLKSTILPSIQDRSMAKIESHKGSMATMKAINEIGGTTNLDRVGDVIFVHGLNGDPIKSWSHDNSQAGCWPYWLAKDCP